MKYVAMDEKSYLFGCAPADLYSNGRVDKRFKEQIPDPFTDANDDYAVLEWMRELGVMDDSRIEYDRAWDKLPERGEYQIGDYARAALKVLDD